LNKLLGRANIVPLLDPEVEERFHPYPYHCRLWLHDYRIWLDFGRVYRVGYDCSGSKEEKSADGGGLVTERRHYFHGGSRRSALRTVQARQATKIRKIGVDMFGTCA